jgi:hypothetical protein
MRRLRCLEATQSLPRSARRAPGQRELCHQLSCRTKGVFGSSTPVLASFLRRHRTAVSASWERELYGPESLPNNGLQQTPSSRPLGRS